MTGNACTWFLGWTRHSNFTWLILTECSVWWLGPVTTGSLGSVGVCWPGLICRALHISGCTGNFEKNEVFEKQWISHFESITPGGKMSKQSWFAEEKETWIESLDPGLSSAACCLWRLVSCSYPESQQPSLWNEANCTYFKELGGLNNLIKKCIACLLCRPCDELLE